MATAKADTNAHSPAPDAPTGAPRKKFRPRDAPRLTPEQAKRQGTAARLAWERLPEPGAAIAFLNEFQAALGGRPIDLAVGSDDGLVAVERALTALRPGAIRP